MTTSACLTCAALREERDQLLRELAELTKLVELQSADIDRQRAEAAKAAEAAASALPNQPERVPTSHLQLAFAEVLQSIQDDTLRRALESVAAPGDSADAGAPPIEGASDQSVATGPGERDRSRPPRKKGHGRRALNLTNLPVEKLVLDPDEVLAANGVGYILIGVESSVRLAFRPGCYIQFIVERRKWKAVEAETATPTSEGLQPEAATDEISDPLIYIASLPDGVWPYFMADVSAIVNGIQSKYGDLLPLNRQQGISARHGFEVPRSTMCGWLGAAHEYCKRIVDAMRAESVAKAFCIATDATGAPVRPPGKGPLERWQVFVFIADRDHIFFDYARSGTSAAVSAMLEGYGGYVLADAATIFDTLYETSMIEVGCWSHMRRYFWKALASDGPRAMQALSLITKLFLVDRECAAIEMPRRTEVRAAKAKPILDALDAWVNANDAHADPRSPLAAALTYYRNQRDALRRFLEDGRLPIHNNASESGLRNLVLGRHNWVFFETATGLDYYTVFRSLIASCALHDLNPESYLQEVLRLTPHWPVNRVVELSPKYWRQTRENLTPHQLETIAPPWERSSKTISTQPSAEPRAA